MTSIHPTRTSLTSHDDYQLINNEPRLSQKAYDTKCRPRKNRRLGFWICFLVSISLTLLTACVAFLFWLWWVQLDQPTWRQLVLSQYATQSITITGLLVRAAMGIIATISTSMIASIAIEKRGVPLESVAMFSVARFINNGPIYFLYAIFDSATFDISLRLLTVLLLFATLASQFTSTLLVSDLASGDVIAFPGAFADAYDVEDQDEIGRTLAAFSASATLWERAPYSAEAFAEYWKPVANVDGIDDTGPTIRAYLPLAVQRDRETVQSLTATARVVDARVVCVRPQISNLHTCTSWVDEGTSKVSLCGNVTRGDTPGNIWGPQTQEFTLPLGGLPTPTYRWVLSAMTGGLVTDLSNTSSVADQMASMQDGSVLLSDSLGLSDQADFRSLKTGVRFNNVNSTTDGAWLHEEFQVDSGNQSSIYNISLSWCYQAFALGPVHFLNITASSNQSRTEPQYVWNKKNNAYDSTQVRRQLGAVAGARMSDADRQILTLSPNDVEGELEQLRNKPLDPVYQSNVNFLDTGSIGTNSSLALCPVCGAKEVFPANVVLTNLFADALDEAGSPAKAIQAAMTVQSRMEYYSTFNTFIAARNGSMAMFQSVKFPQAWRGFGAVLGIIGAQLLAFLLITILFFRHTRFSYPGEVWHTVSQMSESSIIKQILVSSKTAKDEDVITQIRDTSEPYAFHKADSQTSQSVLSLHQNTANSFHPRFRVQEGVFSRVYRIGHGTSN